MKIYDMFEFIGETKLGKCPYCGKEMVKHIIKEGARYHVTSWYKGNNGAIAHCSTENCEHNHGPGHCVPYSEEDLRDMKLKPSERMRKIFEKYM
jgi:ssDNA-binding Zn-finger/Zn-ribbon topoisomerase 1